MSVTFWGNFASPHWRNMCSAHQSSREGSLCVREAEETVPDPWSAFTSSIQPQLRDGSLLMTPGQHRAEAQRMRRAGRGARGTKRSPSAGAVGKIARLPTEAFHVDSRFTAWSHSRPGSGSPSFRQLNDALCDRYRGRIFADDQPEPSQRSFEARRHTRDVFWPKRMIAFEKGSNWHIRP